MVNANPTHSSSGQRHTAVRAFNSLTGRDVDAVRESVRAEGEHYVVEQHLDYDGYMSLLLTARDDADRAFLISGRTNSIELSAVSGDTLRGLGVFPDIASAMASLQPALDDSDWRWLDGAGPASA